MRDDLGFARAAAAVFFVVGPLVAVALSAEAGPAAAGELAGVTLPDQITVEGKTLLLNGLGLREATWLKVDVYVAGLYLEEKSSDPDAIIASERPKRIVMRFVRDVGGKDLVKAWNESFEENAGQGFAALKERVGTLDSWMPDVIHKGEAITFTYLPERGVGVDVQDRSRGVLPGADFARALFRIWLGPKPPGAALKAGLLGH